MANLYPDVATLLNAHRAYFNRLFEEPALQSGATRWGLKEVRLSADDAHYLKLLYPNCKLLFLVRNPYDAYRSWAARRNASWKWYYRWPDQPVTAKLFGQIWKETAESFVQQAEQLDALLVRYEDLKDRRFDRIESYLGFELNQEAAAVRPTDGPPPLSAIPDSELAEFDDVIGELAESLGYTSPSRDATNPTTYHAAPPPCKNLLRI